MCHCHAVRRCVSLENGIRNKVAIMSPSDGSAAVLVVSFVSVQSVGVSVNHAKKLECCNCNL